VPHKKGVGKIKKYVIIFEKKSVYEIL